MRAALIWFLIPAIGGLWLFTLAGTLAPVKPAFDLINHFRFLILQTAIVLLVLVAWARSKFATWAAAALVLVNVGLATPAFLLAAESTVGSVATRPLGLVFVNMAGQEGRDPSLVHFLDGEDPDLVLLLEADPVAEPVLAELAARYPYRVGCSGNHRCRMVLLSKLALEDARAVPRSAETPPHITARIQSGEGPLAFLGAHVARPLYADHHKQDMAALARLIGEQEAPLIVAGDLNATPWSWSLTHLQRTTGLRRHRTLGATWPNRRPFTPLLLIDHILVSPDIAVLDARSGPDLGSDHLPTIARLAVPAGRQ